MSGGYSLRQRNSQLLVTLCLAALLCLSGCVPTSSTRVSVKTDGIEPDVVRGALIEIATKNELVAHFYSDSVSPTDPFRLLEGGWRPGWYATFGNPKLPRFSAEALVRKGSHHASLTLVESDIERKGLSADALRIAIQLREDLRARFGESNVVQEE